MTSISPETDPASSDAGDTGPSGTFDEYPLSPVLLTALAERGMAVPTPIQAAAIPALLNGRDVVGQARTGSGKTLAFSLPLLEAVDAGRASVQALVLAPTRELASQVAAVIADLGTTKGITVALLYGGTSSGPQRTALRRGAQVAVGTPGRILDLIGQGALWLDQARFVVLDEADEMFDQGFAQDVERIMDKTSNSRQTALFSATMPEWVRQTAARYLYDPETIAVDAGSEPTSLVPHIAYVVPPIDRGSSRSGYGRGRDDADMQAKVVALRDLLDHRGEGSTIVFGRTKQGVDTLSKQLDRAGYPVGALQGNMTQAERDFVMASFRSGRIDILVATNVAARGLDLVGVNLVVNVELPESAELLTHRVGRTGRMGRGGQAITLLAGADLARWQLLIRDVTLPIRQLPWPGAVAALALGEDQPAVIALDDLPVPPTLAAEPVTEPELEPEPEPDLEFEPDDVADAFAESPKEEAPRMDESDSQAASTRPGQPGDARPAATAPDGYRRPTRRASRRPAEPVASTPPVAAQAPAERARPAGDASDLIARALASVGVTGAAPAPPPVAPTEPALAQPPRPTTQRATASVAAPPVPQSQPRREERRSTTPAEPVVTQASAPEPLRGTPRPAWVRSAAERVAHWPVGSAPAVASAIAAPVVPPVGSPSSDRPEAAPAAQPSPEHRVAAAPAFTPVPAPTQRPAPAAEPAPLRTTPAPWIDAPAAQSVVPAPQPATPPQVRRRGTPRPADQDAPARSVAAAVPAPVTLPEPRPTEPVAAPAPPAADAPRIPTVRASRSRPATPPAAPPASETTADVAPLLAAATAPEPEPVTPEPVAAQTIDVPATTTLPEDTADPSSPAAAEETTAEAPTPVVDEPVEAPAPPTRRRSRASRTTAAETPAPEQTTATATASSLVAPEEATDAPAAPPKPRRASSRKTPSEPVEPVEPPAVARATPAPIRPIGDLIDAALAVAGAAPAPTTDTTDEPAAPQTRRGRGRAAASDPAEPTDTTTASAGSGEDPPATPDKDPAAAPTPASGRSGSRRSGPATPADGDQPAPGNRRRASQDGDRTTAASRGRAAKTDEQPAPGNRRSPSPRTTEPSGDGPDGNREPAGGAAGSRGRSASGRPASGPERNGNTGGPPIGNSASARPATRSAFGGASSGGAAPRRRFMTTPATTRCAACGTPNPKGSTRKYCPACERELAVRSQES